MTLYEINKLIEDALDGAIDPETGEVVDEELMAAYEQLQMDRADKIENVACYIKNLEADAKAIREEEKALAARRKAAENKAEHLKDYLQFCLAGEKFSSPRAAVSFRKSTQVQVDDIWQLPDDLLRYKDPEPDKTAIKEALKEGRVVPGAVLVENVSMIIK